MTETRDINHAHICCGIGGGASGFNRGQARVKSMRARFRCLGGVDVDPACCADFENNTGAKATQLDLMLLNQYVAFHGRLPPPGWREAVPDDIRRAFQHKHPHILFMSMPCKGFSGLLSEKISQSAKYQALNGLALRGLWLALEAYEDDPVELILFENVPRIATRGRWLLDHIVPLLRAYGYAAVESKHDCGELGNLAQHRERFLLVARHMEKVPAFLYQPPKRPLRGVGEILSKLPLPGLVDAAGVPLGGPMHRVPRLQWKTWVRLAFVEAGSDWRSLNKLAVENGFLKDYGIAADTDWNGGVLGVQHWHESSGTITGRGSPTTGKFAVADPRVGDRARRQNFGVHEWPAPCGVIGGESLPSNGAFAVADPRVDGHPKSVQLGVRRWDRPAGVVTGKMIAGGGPHAVADPRISGKPRFNHVFRIVRFDRPSPAIAGPGGSGGGLGVADPRPAQHPGYKQTKYRVTRFDEPSRVVIGASTTGQGAFAVADPRWREGRTSYLTSGHYGVVPWSEPSGAIRAAGQHDNSAASVADPRIATVLPGATDNLVCLIRALDGTWHRPFTTLECAALQSLVDAEELFGTDGLPFDLIGASDSAKRERIGNCVPPDAAAAIASVMGQVLLLVWSGESAPLADTPVWVRQLAVSLSVKPMEIGE